MSKTKDVTCVVHIHFVRMFSGCWLRSHSSIAHIHYLEVSIRIFIAKRTKDDTSNEPFFLDLLADKLDASRFVFQSDMVIGRVNLVSRWRSRY